MLDPHTDRVYIHKTIYLKLNCQTLTPISILIALTIAVAPVPEPCSPCQQFANPIRLVNSLLTVYVHPHV
eukprot:79206-Amorphochlora_amoeboformis.AAC.1